MLNDKISTEDLRKVVENNPYSFAEAQIAADKLHKNKPFIPEGYPKNFSEALFYEGACALPLYSVEDEGWNFYAFANGSPILYDGKWGEESRFPSYKDAVEFAQEWVKQA